VAGGCGGLSAGGWVAFGEHSLTMGARVQLWLSFGVAVGSPPVLNHGRPSLHGLVAVVVLAAAATAGAAPGHAVRVVRCHTEYGVPPGPITGRARLRARGSPRSTASLVAYTNTEEFLIGPAGMACSGLIGADGGGRIIVWRRGQHSLGEHAHRDGMTFLTDPACVGCQAGDACPFFRAFASGLGFPCSGGVPPGEVVTRKSPRRAFFEDPPGVEGDGWPSGGPNPANGVVAIQGSLSPGPRQRSVSRATCTLPARAHATCTVSLNDVVARYG
jgi:hypothetical protein